MLHIRRYLFQRQDPIMYGILADLNSIISLSVIETNHYY
jgi:hypothetical protein